MYPVTGVCMCECVRVSLLLSVHVCVSLWVLMWMYVCVFYSLNDRDERMKSLCEFLLAVHLSIFAPSICPFHISRFLICVFVECPLSASMFFELSVLPVISKASFGFPSFTPIYPVKSSLLDRPTKLSVGLDVGLEQRGGSARAQSCQACEGALEKVPA